MEVYKAILKRRTIRIFKNKKIPKRILKKLVNAARLAPSARNLQPLEYLVVDDPKLCDLIFENVYFGGEVEKLRKKENRPVAYILVLVNKKIRESGFEHDVGLAVGNLVLVAFEKGIGCCIMGAIEREKIKKIFKIPENYYLDLVVALGYPAENPVLEEGEGKYWRDEKEVLHVPKRPLKKILHWNKF
jgi:nitroreductase